MIRDREIIHAIKHPQRNRWVSQERPDKRKIKVTTETADTERLLQLTAQIRESEDTYLESIAKKHATLASFLNDPHISPSPRKNVDLTPFMAGDILRFTVGALAPKAGNPYKTDQILPDLGEIAVLVHFEELARVATEKYGKPVEFTLLAESHYIQELDMMDPQRVKAYDERVRFLSREIVQNKRVKLVEWYDAVLSLPGYKEEYRRQRAKLVQELAENPSAIRKDFLSIVPNSYMSIQPVDGDIDAIYSLRQSEATRRQIQKATDATLNLMAFNQARKICGERDILFPGYVYGSLTPGPGKFAFYAIGPWNERYPNHGVGVLDTKTGRVSVRQRRAIKESQKSRNIRTVA